tara:strand:+ start:7551 stop:7679 length:129 start_codon:yes stop_codon:yes gene_type:complete
MALVRIIINCTENNRIKRILMINKFEFVKNKKFGNIHNRNVI